MRRRGRTVGQCAPGDAEAKGAEETLMVHFIATVSNFPAPLIAKIGFLACGILLLWQSGKLARVQVEWKNIPPWMEFPFRAAFVLIGLVYTVIGALKYWRNRIEICSTVGFVNGMFTHH
jgi:hypothetical protein